MSSQHSAHCTSISIHAPTRGATPSWETCTERGKYFNPRSHEGSDLKLSFEFGFLFKFSIHAPTRGATVSAIIVIHRVIAFQSTLPRGERLLIAIFIIVPSFISIHAPTRGATVHIGGIIAWELISIHAPTRGATVNKMRQLLGKQRFQSTLPRGERRRQPLTRKR